MKHSMFIFFFLIMFCQAVFSKPPKLPKIQKGEWIEPVKPKTICNNWVWIETDCCGARHGVSSPRSTGDSIMLKLRNDNSFLETHTKMNTLSRSGNFTLRRDGENDVIQFNDERPARYLLSEQGDTLTLSWKYLELQTEKYVKQK